MWILDLFKQNKINSLFQYAKKQSLSGQMALAQSIQPAHDDKSVVKGGASGNENNYIKHKLNKFKPAPNPQLRLTFDQIIFPDEQKTLSDNKAGIIYKKGNRLEYYPFTGPHTDNLSSAKNDIMHLVKEYAMLNPRIFGTNQALVDRANQVLNDNKPTFTPSYHPRPNHGS